MKTDIYDNPIKIKYTGNKPTLLELKYKRLLRYIIELSKQYYTVETNPNTPQWQKKEKRVTFPKQLAEVESEIGDSDAVDGGR